MSPKERIEEAHGLWEIAAAIALGRAEMLELIHEPCRDQLERVTEALVSARMALDHWRDVSAAADNVAELEAPETSDRRGTRTG